MMRKDTITRAALAALVLACGTGAASAAAPASNTGFYAGASVGGSSWSGSVNTVQGNSGGVSGKLFGGYQFSPNFALEAGVMDLGRLRGSTGDASADGAFLDGVGSYEFAPKWSVLGRVGLAHARFSTPGLDHSGNGAKLGVGVQYDLTPTVALRGEYEYYHFNSVFNSSVHVGQYTAGVKVSF